MSFLKAEPSVFVIGDSYELLFCLSDFGLLSLSVGGELYYEENAGCLPSERTVCRIRVPQAALDAAGSYELVYRKTVERRAYFSLFGEEERMTFSFSPVPSEGAINLYFLADVHYFFAAAERTATYFGEELQLLVAAGDLGEVETEENYLEVAALLGRITHGRIPIVMVRGNHDTRGRLSERYCDFFPANGKDTYYTFTLGALSGVVLDCGEDKPDDFCPTGEGYDGSPVYNGTNIFEAFRRRESEFLRRVHLPEGRPRLAISHVCPSMTAMEAGSIFDIERELYGEWNRELSRIGIDVMLTGHLHRLFTLDRNDPRALLPNPYPVIVGAKPITEESVVGTAITLYTDRLVYRFTDSDRAVLGEGEILFSHA